MLLQYTQLLFMAAHGDLFPRLDFSDDECHNEADLMEHGKRLGDMQVDYRDPKLRRLSGSMGEMPNLHFGAERPGAGLGAEHPGAPAADQTGADDLGAEHLNAEKRAAEQLAALREHVTQGHGARVEQCQTPDTEAMMQMIMQKFEQFEQKLSKVESLEAHIKAAQEMHANAQEGVPRAITTTESARLVTTTSILQAMYTIKSMMHAEQFLQANMVHEHFSVLLNNTYKLYGCSSADQSEKSGLMHIINNLHADISLRIKTQMDCLDFQKQRLHALNVLFGEIRRQDAYATFPPSMHRREEMNAMNAMNAMDSMNAMNAMNAMNDMMWPSTLGTHGARGTNSGTRSHTTSVTSTPRMAIRSAPQTPLSPRQNLAAAKRNLV